MINGGKRIKMYVIYGLISIAVVAGLFVGCASSFGARAKGASLRNIETSNNYKNGKFVNLEETTVMNKDASIVSNTRDWLNGSDDSVPTFLILSEKFDKDNFIKSNNGVGVTWFGHSTVLLNINGFVVLIDPMFSKNSSPVHFGVKAFQYINTASIADLPDIEIVLISHDHYDHLDMDSIKKLKGKVKTFVVPLGVGSHLKHWGISEKQIVELDWWQNYSADGNIRLTSTPARHFSGRRMFNRNTTLWCSYVIATDKTKIYFSGDSGYGRHFKDIGEKFGPFDLAIMECGQYNKNWPFIHMNPEETLQAFDDLKGKILFPVHWGKFKLSLHPWREPVERISSGKRSRKIFTPVIGSTVYSSSETAVWWK